MQEIKICPICAGIEFVSKFTCKDYTVSQESFKIIECVKCHFLITSPRPDESEIGKYYLSDKYISHSGKAKTLIDSIYLKVRNITLAQKLKLVESYKGSAEILDYGCGTGEFLNSCKTNFWNISGVEPSISAREKASKLTQTDIHSSIDSITNKKYDVITLWHVLEHITSLENTLLSLIEKLKEGGTLIIAVPNHKSEDAIYYNEYWAAYDVPRHLWHFSKETMSKLLTKHSLTITKIQPMKFDSFYVSMLSENHKNGKSSLLSNVKAFAKGLLSNSKAASTGEYSSLIYVIKK